MNSKLLFILVAVTTYSICQAAGKHFEHFHLMCAHVDHYVLCIILFIDRCHIPNPLEIDHCSTTCNSTSNPSWNVTMTNYEYNSYKHITTVTYRAQVMYDSLVNETGVCSQELDTDRPFLDTFYLVYDGCCTEPRITTVTAGTWPNMDYGFKFIQVLLFIFSFTIYIICAYATQYRLVGFVVSKIIAEKQQKNVRVCHVCYVISC